MESLLPTSSSPSAAKSALIICAAFIPPKLKEDSYFSNLGGDLVTVAENGSSDVVSRFSLGIL